MLVARGGMADVYRATDVSLQRDVAIKLLSDRFAADPDTRTRFRREALTAASLSSHPNVVTIYDVGEADGRPYIVMEYFAGGSLADRIAEGSIDRVEALAWLEQAARGLDAAHAAGVVHRDVKPANLLLGGDGVVRVTDFGIARAAAHAQLTSTGTILGTSGYMAPEQARGEPVSDAADRYAFACVAFELLTGRRPFVAETPTTEAALHATSPPPMARSLDPSLPLAVDAALGRSLAKDPAARHATAADLVRELRRALDVRDDAPTAVLTPRVHRQTRRRRLPLGLAAAGVVALLAAGAATGMLLGGDEATRDQTVVVTQMRTTRVVETAPPETQVETVTIEQPSEPPPEPDDEPASSGDAIGDNDRGYALMQQGDFEGALPLVERAQAALAGTGSLAEAYASYNLAYTRLTLGSCDGVLELLRRSEEVQGKRKEIDRLEREARRACED